MEVYNTLTREKEELTPIKKGEVGIYSCGPTVYWNQHIGNMYAYIQWDILVRFLRFNGFSVKWVMNITDVGHMTSDADSGEDKMEKGAKREGLSPWQIADKYIEQFLGSMDALNISRPDVLCRATEHINEQIALIKKIEARGFTYKTKTGVVFDTSKFPDYAKFAHLNLQEQDSGARVEVDPEKKNPWDFLLWVTNQPNHIMQWDSPWGRGFPGWHIECTAMSTKYLGDQFDIHTGGKEHIPVHHTNEIAQGYGAFGRRTANFWLHNEWLVINKEKVSKSLGNTVLVGDIIKKGLDPISFRYLALNSHYRQGLNFTWESLEAAQTALFKAREIVAQLGKDEGDGRAVISQEKVGKIETFRERFQDALNDDLGVPQALAAFWEMIKSNVPSRDKLDLAVAFDGVLGLKLVGGELGNEKTPDDVMILVKKRDDLRSSGNFRKADEVRREILGKGYQILDTPEGTKVKKKN